MLRPMTAARATKLRRHRRIARAYGAGHRKLADLTNEARRMPCLTPRTIRL